MASFAELGAVQSNLVDRGARANATAQSFNQIYSQAADRSKLIRDTSNRVKDTRTSWMGAVRDFSNPLTQLATPQYQRGTATFEGPDGQLRGAPSAVLQNLSYAEAMGVPGSSLESLYSSAPKGMYASYAQADLALKRASENPFFQGQGSFEKVTEAKRQEGEARDALDRSRSGQQVFTERAGGPSSMAQRSQVEVEFKRTQEALRRANQAKRKDLGAVQDAVHKSTQELRASTPVFANVPIKETIQSPLKPKRR